MGSKPIYNSQIKLSDNIMTVSRTKDFQISPLDKEALARLSVDPLMSFEAIHSINLDPGTALADDVYLDQNARPWAAVAAFPSVANRYWSQGNEIFLSHPAINQDYGRELSSRSSYPYGEPDLNLQETAALRQRGFTPKLFQFMVKLQYLAPVAATIEAIDYFGSESRDIVESVLRSLNLSLASSGAYFSVASARAFGICNILKGAKSARIAGVLFGLYAVGKAGEHLNRDVQNPDGASAGEYAATGLEFTGAGAMVAGAILTGPIGIGVGLAGFGAIMMADPIHEYYSEERVAKELIQAIKAQIEASVATEERPATYFTRDIVKWSQALLHSSDPEDAVMKFISRAIDEGLFVRLDWKYSPLTQAIHDPLFEERELSPGLKQICFDSLRDHPSKMPLKKALLILVALHMDRKHLQEALQDFSNSALQKEWEKLRDQLNLQILYRSNPINLDGLYPTAAHLLKIKESMEQEDR